MSHPKGMSGKHGAISLFLVFHLTAMVVGAIPAPSLDLQPPDSIRHPTGDPLAARVTPVLDRFAGWVGVAHPRLWTAAGPLRVITDPYLHTLGLTQQWRMFANPPRIDEYLRVRYYVSSDATPDRPVRSLWMATELVFPAHREDQIRTFQSFRDSSRDKAIATALGRFHAENFPSSSAPPADRSAATGDMLAPFARYFARRFERERLHGGERILRVELWHGAAPGRPRGSGSEARPDQPTRRETLRQYYRGPLREPLFSTGYPPFLATQTESDIVWALEYIEQR